MFFAMLFVVLNNRKCDKILGIGYIKLLCKYNHELTYKEYTHIHTHTHIGKNMVDNVELWLSNKSNCGFGL